MPIDEPVQDRVDVPEVPVTLVGVRLHPKLVELVLTVRLVVPSVGMLTVIVDVPVARTRTDTLVGLEVRVNLAEMV